MAISAVQSNPQADLVSAINGSNGGVGSASTVEEMSDRFLKLLVTQLKNQDPMNPMENAELTSQLAQMSTVEGINKLNDGMSALSAQFRASQVIQGASLVGHQVLAEGDVFKLTAAGAAGGFDLASRADKVNVQVLNSGGSLVHSFELGAKDAGLQRFAWDGYDSNGARLPEGDYFFQVQASAADKPVVNTTYSLGSVLSVALTGDAMDVEVSGLGSRTMDQIKQIY
jgi:flagellar basal-body rod modification protein FlgD